MYKCHIGLAITALGLLFIPPFGFTFLYLVFASLGLFPLLLIAAPALSLLRRKKIKRPFVIAVLMVLNSILVVSIIAFDVHSVRLVYDRSIRMNHTTNP
jgi:uncharacterized membrane protein YfhO